MLPYLASHLPELLAVVLAHFVAVASPGPDFILVVKNALSRGRRHGVASAVGIGAGIALHTTYSLLGIALIIAQSVLLFNVIKTIGALYLLWIGYKALLSKKAAAGAALEAAPVVSEQPLWRSGLQGFLTNALNPKATLFFLSLYSLIISAATPLSVKLFYGTEMTLATMLWFSFVTFFLTVPAVQRQYRAIGHWIDRAMGAILVALGLKILLTTKQ